MSHYPTDLDSGDLYEAYRLIRDLRLKAVMMRLKPKAITIALWMAVEMDRILGLTKISTEEYQCLIDCGRQEAQKTARRFGY